MGYGRLCPVSQMLLLMPTVLLTSFGRTPAQGARGGRRCPPVWSGAMRDGIPDIVYRTWDGSAGAEGLSVVEVVSVGDDMGDAPMEGNLRLRWERVDRRGIYGVRRRFRYQPP